MFRILLSVMVDLYWRIHINLQVATTVAIRLEEEILMIARHSHRATYRLRSSTFAAD